MNAKWSVLAVYRDATARDSAVNFTDVLVQRFWAEATFDIEWKDWEALQDARTAKEAGWKAERANIIIIATGAPGKIEPHVRTWLEWALSKREEREGILVGLSQPNGCPTADAAATQQYLTKLAHQKGLDYLTSVPQSLSQGVPETVEACNLRATQVTSVLNTILGHMPPPPRLL